MFGKAILCAVLGGLGGALAFFIARPFLGDVAFQNIHPDYTLGSTFGWLGHGLLGAFIVSTVSAVLGYNDWGARGALICGLAGFVLGSVGGWGSDALYDWLMIQGKIPGGGATHFIWSGFVCAALSLAVFLSTGAKGHRIVKSLAAAGVATLVGTFTRNMIGSTMATGRLLNAVNNPSSLRRDNRWIEAGPEMLAEFVVVGIVIGAIFGLVELVMKSVRLRQVLGTNEWRTWVLGDGAYRVGSAEGSEIRVAESNVVPLHAYIMRQNGQFCVQEANGGLIVNGAQTPAHWLSDGDLIQIGAATFFFGEGSPPAPRAATTEVRPMNPAAVTTAAPDHRLLDNFGNIFPLKQGSHVIGRDAAADISVTWDAKVSRRHAEVQVTPSGVTVQDLGSTNGTTLDGTPVQSPVPVLPGAKIQVGSTVFTYQA